MRYQNCIVYNLIYTKITFSHTYRTYFSHTYVQTYYKHAHMYIHTYSQVLMFTCTPCLYTQNHSQATKICYLASTNGVSIQLLVLQRYWSDSDCSQLQVRKQVLSLARRCALLQMHTTPLLSTRKCALNRLLVAYLAFSFRCLFSPLAFYLSGLCTNYFLPSSNKFQLNFRQILATQNKCHLCFLLQPVFLLFLFAMKIFK